MAVQRISVEAFLTLAEKHPVLDVRSPGEYARAHIPGAHAFPLFSDEERAMVGTAYKQQSRQMAIQLGLQYFGPQMLTHVLAAEKLAAAYHTKTLLLHCWRGGMRSGAMAWLLDLYGFKIYTLQGGYKAYRQWVLETIVQPPRLRVIGGYTGSGKTEILQALQAMGEPVIDLEALASHKGSAFGAIGMPEQPRQEHFENLLAAAFYQCNRQFPNQPVWIENESQRIGKVQLPMKTYYHLLQQPTVFVTIPFAERLEHIVKGYGQQSVEGLANAIERLRKKLGGLVCQQALAHLHAGDFRACFELLLQYYDKLYLRSGELRNPALVTPYYAASVNATANATELLARKNELYGTD